MKVLFIGDIFGKPGRDILKKDLNSLKNKHEIDICIANGENSAGGIGITYHVIKELKSYGVDVITTGNHAFSKKDVSDFLDLEKNVIRPANYPLGTPGAGNVIFSTLKGKVGVINLQGRVYMNPMDNPFTIAERELSIVKAEAKVTIVDFHAEATSEKAAMAWHLDGRASCVLGTHTHVQTADEKILASGTGFISDVGMTGPADSIIGTVPKIIVNKFVTCIHEKYVPANGRAQMNAVVLDIDENTGKTVSIERINYVV